MLISSSPVLYSCPTIYRLQKILSIWDLFTTF